MEKLKPGWVRCVECKWTFRPVNKRQKFCADRCGDSYRARKYYRAKTGRGGKRRRERFDGQDYADMLALFRTGEWTFEQIAEKFGTTRRYVHEVIRSKCEEVGYVNYKRKCLHCGGDFLATRSTHKYCSSDHATQASQQRARAAAKAKREPLAESERVRLALRLARWRREDYNAYGVWI